MSSVHSYRKHLSKDKKLAAMLNGSEDFSPITRSPVYLWLGSSIVGQQLSVTVAATIRKRFLGLYSGEPSPEDILATSLPALRSIGLSNAKAAYVHNVARYALEAGLEHDTLGKMTNEEVIAHVTKIKGVGRWTAEMLLMFTLGREDVFSADDLGIQQAMTRLYRLDSSDKKKFRQRMLKISETWAPYRTYACLHLWHHKDNTPVSSKERKKTSAVIGKKNAAAKSTGNKKAAVKTVKKNRAHSASSPVRSKKVYSAKKLKRNV